MNNCTLYVVSDKYDYKKIIDNPHLVKFVPSAFVELCLLLREPDDRQHIHVFLKEGCYHHGGVVCFTIDSYPSEDEVTSRAKVNIAAISKDGEMNTMRIKTDTNSIPTLNHTYLRIAKNAFLNLL